MAQAREFRYPIQVQEGNDNSRQLLEIQLNERENARGGQANHQQNTASRSVNPVDVSDVLLTPYSGQLFAGKGRNDDSLTGLDYFKKESNRSQLHIGVTSGTTTKSYPNGSKMLGLRHGTRFQETPKPKLVGDKTPAIVYSVTQYDYARLQSSVLPFN